MIAFLRGRLLSSGDDGVVVEVGGIGLRVQVPEGVRRELPRPGQVVELHTHMVVRENDISLYGFATVEELEQALVLKRMAARAAQRQRLAADGRLSSPPGNAPPTPPSPGSQTADEPSAARRRPPVRTVRGRVMRRTRSCGWLRRRR